MAEKKNLTLRVEQKIAVLAHQLSKETGESISSLFSRYIQARYAFRKTKYEFSPRTREALEIGKEISKKIPKDKSYKELLVEALAEKYNVKLK